MKFMKKSIIISLFISLLIYLPVQAQVEVEISTTIEIVNGKAYHIHEVIKGQTLYSISKAYEVSIDIIKDCNKLSDNQLNTGYLLKIPAKKQDINNENIESDGINYNLQNHIVVKGESLFGIAKQYSSTVEQLKKINSGLNDNISPGQLILVPIKVQKELKDSSLFHIVETGETLYSIAKMHLLSVKELKKLNLELSDNIQIGQKIIVGKQGETSETEDSVKTNCEDPILLNEYNIALLIPLHMEYSQSRIFRSDDKDKNDFYQFSPFAYIEFYEGLKIAIDTMKKAGMNINLHVYDLDESKEKLNKTISSPALSKMHLIIGPFSDTYLDTISAFSYEHKIPLVSSFLSGEVSLREINPYYINPITSIYYQMIALADFFKDKREDANVIVSYQPSEMEMAAAIALDSTLNELEFKSHAIVNINESGLSGITANFHASKENIIITLANGEIFVSNYIRNLNEYKKNFSITLMPLPGWLKYKNLDLEFLEHLNSNFFGSYFIDYQREDNRDFAKKFQKEYKSDPGKYAFLGYDIGVYFLSALHNYGPQFCPCMQEHHVNTLSINFKWIETSGEGFHNNFINIYKMKDFQLWNIENNKN